MKYPNHVQSIKYFGSILPSPLVCYTLECQVPFVVRKSTDSWAELMNRMRVLSV